MLRRSGDQRGEAFGSPPFVICRMSEVAGSIAQMFVDIVAVAEKNDIAEDFLTGSDC
jgi:hypothetical protein